ncbi:MAG: TMEM165/GDT1 family protein [Oscillatoriales cyanobacterium C42_A2020_001]|nr:TMEM165/GDT1 family protein [Leptolyngbyaceae cyanobacterium C42_A2020_001]
MPALDVAHTPSLLEVQSDSTVVSESTISTESTLGVADETGATSDRTSDTRCITEEQPGCPPWRVVTSTFITIFLAEIGDKTQVSTLLMSAEFHKPWTVFLGAGAALVATTLLGVWLGQWLSTRLSPRTLDVAAGILLALISASLIWDVLQM